MIPTDRRNRTIASLLAVTALFAGAQGHAEGSQPLPPLAAVVALAEARAPQLAVAAARQRLGDASRAAGNWHRVQNPTLEARAGAQGGGPDAQFDLWLPVETGDQPATRRQEAKAVAAWLAGQQQVAHAEVRGWAVHAWGRAAVAAAKVRMLREITATADQEAQALARRAAARDVPEQDARLARMEVLRFASQLAQAQAEFAKTATELSMVLDEVPDRCDHPAEPDQPVPAPAAGSPTDVPQVAALLREADAHAAAVQRAIAEAQPPWQAVLGAGRDPAGGLRVNAGVAWTPPLWRSGQVETARAAAEREMAKAEAAGTARQARLRWQALANEDRDLAAADRSLTESGRSWSQAALAATTATWRAGKSDWTAVLLARRNVAELELRHLDLVERRWAIRGEWAALTGMR